MMHQYGHSHLSFLYFMPQPFENGVIIIEACENLADRKEDSLLGISFWITEGGTFRITVKLVAETSTAA